MSSVQPAVEKPESLEEKKEIQDVENKGAVHGSAGAAYIETEDLATKAHDEGIETSYQAKCALLNNCYQTEIGMGRYQWELFVLSGFGWLVDNLWLQGVAIILPQVQKEFKPPHIAFATLALYVGLICGALTWGILADVIGRRLSWNITLFIGGVFGIAAGGANNFVTLASLLACLGFGVGGNLPVDGALFLEFIPASHQWLLTFLSIWWPFGQLIASLVAWAFIANYSCLDPDVNAPCPKDQNWGWRYTYFTLGSVTFVMFIFRFFIFRLQESPKYLIAKGRDEDAVATLEYIAKHNKRTITLTAEKLRNAAGEERAEESVKFTAWELVKKNFAELSFSHVKPLFQTKKLALNTSLVFGIWSLIGLSYPLYNAFLPIYLAQRSSAQGDSSVNTTYRNYAIISVMGIPGSIIAAFLVEWKIPYGGRKLAMILSTALTGVFLFLFTTARNEAAVLGWNCATGLTQNALYGVIYGYTPEVFPAPHRGTADAIASSLNRVFGMMAPIIATYGDLNSNAPLYVSASLFLSMIFLIAFLPIETRGRAAL